MLLLLVLLACAPAPAPKVELSALMLRFQTHAAKLWFSGQANNWPLAGFYVTELGETWTELREGAVVHDGHDVSALVDELLKPELLAVQEAVVTGDRPGFEAAYDSMLQHCNACHARTGHPYLVIRRPAAPDWTNQVFDPSANAPPAPPPPPHDEASPFDND